MCQIGIIFSFQAFFISFGAFSGVIYDTRCLLYLWISTARHAMPCHQTLKLEETCCHCLTPTFQTLGVGTAILHTSGAHAQCDPSVVVQLLRIHCLLATIPRPFFRLTARTTHFRSARSRCVLYCTADETTMGEGPLCPALRARFFRIDASPEFCPQQLLTSPLEFELLTTAR